MSSISTILKYLWMHISIRKYKYYSNLLIVLLISGKDYDLVSYTTYIVCVNTLIYVSSGTCNLKSTPNDVFFKKLFIAILLTLRVFNRNLLEGSRLTYIFSYFVLLEMSPDWRSHQIVWTMTSRLIKQTYYVLDFGD